VLAAAAQNSKALCHADDGLWRDRNFILTAASQP